ncbi:THAP domain-containing protein 5-like [Colias croceus]|uniref:THAP domain-containing protein 5-like n=1 Tax=Colias crocea TaxID=72248 RepID=UPI001E27AE7E|nr:THAP domain-containing protein 5-like [Colias croceus]
MPSCVMRYCFNSSYNTNKARGVTFHQFPHHGHEKREEWIKFVQKNRSEDTWLPSEYSRICSIHFKEDDKYTTKTGRIYLRKTAVPCIDPKKTSEPSSFKPEPLSDSVSSSESIFDSPRTIVLKKKLLKESAARKKLAEKFRILRRKNYYLKEKCARYKTLVRNLTADKFGFDLNKTPDLNTTPDLMAKEEVVE